MFVYFGISRGLFPFQHNELFNLNKSPYLPGLCFKTEVFQVLNLAALMTHRFFLIPSSLNLLTVKMVFLMAPRISSSHFTFHTASCQPSLSIFLFLFFTTAAFFMHNY